MQGVDRLLIDANAVIVDGTVWVAWAAAILVAIGAFVVGLVVGVWTGLITPTAQGSEIAGKSLGLGLVTLAAAYAMAASSGASVFTVSFMATVAAALTGPRPSGVPGLVARGLPLLAVVLILVPLFGLMFGVTMAPSARGGTQPIEFMDAAYYAVLSQQLQMSGIENVYAPAAFDTISGTPVRSWYHWGEIWLGALVLEIPDMTPMHARYHVVLPLLLVSSALLAGTLVRRLAPIARPRAAWVLGAFGMLTLAPVPLVLQDHFDWWARPIGFAITQYGLAYPVTLIGLLALTAPRTERPRPLILAALASALVAAHLLIAGAAAVGVAAAGLHRLIASPSGPLPRLDSYSLRAGAFSLLFAIATIAWGVASGYGVGGGSVVAGITPFGVAWWRAVGLVLVGSGVMAIGAVATHKLRTTSIPFAHLVAGAVAAVGAGAFVWGLRLADFNSFHAFYGPLAVILTPLVLAAYVAAMAYARRAGRTMLASLMLAVLAVQSAIGIAATIQRLYEFGPGHYRPIPVASLETMRTLPPGSRLAYSCAPVEELAVWDARLISITAHTGHRVAPICFQADIVARQLGAATDPSVPSPFFSIAPQRELYPDMDSRPSTSDILAFLHRHRIAYIYEDADHLNTMIPGLEVVHREGDVVIYSVP